MSSRQLKRNAVTETVREWLQNGKYSEGEQLPTSDELAKFFGINKRTVASGLAPLVKEHLLERTPYNGTVVSPQGSALPAGNEVALITVGQSRAYGNLSREVNQLLQPHGLYPVVIDETLVDDRPGIESFLMRLTEKKRCAGFLIEGSTSVPYDLLRKYPVRFARQVFLFRFHCAEEIPGAGYVLIDMADIGRKAAEYFAGCGAKRIFFAANAERNYAGIATSMQEQVMRSLKPHAESLGLSFDEENFWSLHRGKISLETLMKKEFSSPCPPDAVFGWDDGHVVRDVMPLLDRFTPGWRKKIPVLGMFNSIDRATGGFPSFDFRGIEVMRIATGMILGERPREKVVLESNLVLP